MSEGRLLIGLTFQQSVIRGDREGTWMDDVRAPARLWHFVIFFSCLNFWRDGGLARWRQAGEGYWSQLPAQRSSTMGFSKIAEPSAIRIRSYLVPTLPSSHGRQQVWVWVHVWAHMCVTLPSWKKKLIKKQKHHHHHLVCDHVRKRVSPLLNLASHFRVGRIVISRLCQQRKL